MKPRFWEDRIVLFAGYLIDNDLKFSTVKSYILAIRSVLAENDIRVSEDQFLLSSLMRACHLNNDRVVTRLLKGKDLLQLLLKETSAHFSRTNCNQPYLEKLHCAMLTAGYYGLLRVGEITLGPHVILARDVHIGQNKNKFLFILNTSKTHNAGSKPQMVKIS